MSSWIALGLLVFAGLILILNHDAGTIGGLDAASFASLMAAVALLIYLGSYVVNDYRGRIANAFRDLIAWAGLALILVAGYSYRGELTSFAHRVTGELSQPGSAIPLMTEQTSEGNSVRIRRETDGHFVARTNVNGKPVTMIVDTGASTVVLRHEDAVALGIDTARLIYSVQVQTANGSSKSARAKISEISVGPLRMRNIRALIAPPGALHQSLLGMSFLSRLRSYEFSGDFLTLRG